MCFHVPIILRMFYMMAALDALLVTKKKKIRVRLSPPLPPYPDRISPPTLK